MTIPVRSPLVPFLAILLTSLLPAKAWAENDFTVGVEGFRDVYHETGELVDSSGAAVGNIGVDIHDNDYGSITGQYEHIGNDFFSALDGRYSQGDSHYKDHTTGLPRSGILDEREQETDFRVRTGMVLQAWHGQLMPYIGVGWRWYFDHGKGLVSDVGAHAYDRRINQLYAPIGITYHYITSGGWRWSPTLEIEPLLYGRVQSQLGEVGDPSQGNVTNTQKSGYGGRAELMVGQQYQSFGWEAGPFIRYWNIQQSNCAEKVVISGTTYCSGDEPDNNRTQYGLGLRVNF